MDLNESHNSLAKRPRKGPPFFFLKSNTGKDYKREGNDHLKDDMLHCLIKQLNNGYIAKDYDEAIDEDHLLRIFGLKSMLHNGSKKKRTISTLLRKEVEVGSWREEGGGGLLEGRVELNNTKGGGAHA